MTLRDQTAIITGAGKGIGRSTAMALAKEGVRLGLIARSQSDLAQLQKELTDQHGVAVHYASADIGNRSEVDAAVASLTQPLGGVEILINNAGIGTFAPLLDMGRHHLRLLRLQVWRYGDDRVANAGGSEAEHKSDGPDPQHR